VTLGALLQPWALVALVVWDFAVLSAAQLTIRLIMAYSAPLAMLLTGLAGYAIARWLLRIRRVRGQVIAGLMVSLLDPHLFTLLFP
jgi:hypothetical protein